MAHYVAVPIMPTTGQERMGTAGTLSGDYRSIANFMRYRFSKHAEPGQYNLYIVEGIGNWVYLRTLYCRAR